MSKIDRNWRGIEQINIEVVEKWLVEQGWVITPSSPDDHILLFQRPGFSFILLPGYKDWSAWCECPLDSAPTNLHRMQDAIKTIAEALDEPTYPLLQKFIEMSKEEGQ